MREIFHRTSIRQYEERPVEPEKIEQMLRAAMAAPSTANQQPWHFYVVTNRETLFELAQVSPYAWPAAKAPVVIVSAWQSEGCRFPHWAQIDLAIATEHLWLAADALGLGGVWLGIAPEEDRMAKTADILGLPEGRQAFALFAFGYAAELRRQEDRFKAERIHYIR